MGEKFLRICAISVRVDFRILAILHLLKNLIICFSEPFSKVNTTTEIITTIIIIIIITVTFIIIITRIIVITVTITKIIIVATKHVFQLNTNQS